MLLQPLTLLLLGAHTSNLPLPALREWSSPTEAAAIFRRCDVICIRRCLYSQRWRNTSAKSAGRTGIRVRTRFLRQEYEESMRLFSPLRL